MILHALLAFSGIVFIRGSSHGIAHAVWEQYAQAVRSLKHNLTRYTSGQKDLAIQLLLGCLLLCALEVCNTDTHDHAFLHLKAARQLIPTAESHCSSSRLFSFAAGFYSYNLALLPSCIGDPADHTIGEDLRFSFRALMRHDTGLGGVLCGCAFTLFQLIPEVYSVTTAIRDSLQVGKAVPVEAALSRQRLHSLVQAWTPETADEDGARCGLIYQHALLALLEIHPLDENSTDSSLYRRQLVINMIDLLQTVPVESNYTTILCWPLAVLGGYAEDVGHHEVIRNYLTEMAEKYGQGNMYQTIKLLELIWNRPDLRQMGPRCLLAAMEAQGCRIMFT